MDKVSDDSKFDKEKGQGWSEGELRAAVMAYVEMRYMSLAQKPYVKKEFYDLLASQFEHRTPKSFEYRMQNISYVYSLMGLEWIPGLKPAKNVGLKNIEAIEALVRELEGVSLPVEATFQYMIASARHSSVEEPSGNLKPQRSSTSVTNYKRNAEVVSWLLNNSKGICEACGCDAPFLKPDGLPYLEVHHLRRLADGGSDTIFNAIAVCPNCHRELHYGANASEIKIKLYDLVTRLKKE